MPDGRGTVIIPTDQLPRTADQDIAATPNDVGSGASYICSLTVTDPLLSDAQDDDGGVIEDDVLIRV